MTKLRPDQVANALAKCLKPVYLISGDEPLLIQEICDNIRQQAKQHGFHEREIYHVEANFNWDNILQSANSLSLFSDKKILDVRINNGKLGDGGSKAITEYCQHLSDDCLLLFVLPKIDKRSQNSKWYKTIEACGDIVTVWPIGRQQMPRWIEQRLALAGLSADPRAIEMLCEKTEGHLLAAAQEVEKLKLLGPGKHIDIETMATAVMSSARFNVFGLIDKALLGDSRAAVASLNGLKGEGTEAAVILWALAKEVRQLSAIKEATECGKNFDMAARQCGVWDNRKALVRSASVRLPLRQLHLLLRKVGRADRMIKGVDAGDVWNQLLDITLSLAGIESFSRRTQTMASRLQ